MIIIIIIKTKQKTKIKKHTNKKTSFEIGQRKFELDWEQIGDIYEGFFSLEYTMATS
jgi:hypothetical protein